MGLNFPGMDPTAQGLGSAGLGLGLLVGAIGGNILEVQLSALQEQNKLNILSSPSITTMDNQMAFTENGERVPYVSYDDGDKEVKFEDAVLRLEITPHVIDEKYLRMDILIKKDEVDMSRQVDGNPFIIKKQTETSLIVENSETIVISGLSKNTGQSKNSGVPGLKDVPVLGWFFKGEIKTDKMEDVLIFITPTILPKKSQMANKAAIPGYKSVEDLKKLAPTKDPRALEWLERSTERLNAEDWPECLRLASIAVTLDPGLADAYVNIGRSWYERGQMQQAFENTAVALHLDEENARALNLKGLIMEATGRIPEALENFRKSCGMGHEPGCRNDQRLFYDSLSAR